MPKQRSTKRPNNGPSRPRPSNIGRKPRGFWGGLFYWVAVGFMWLAVIGVVLFIWVASDLPDPEELWKKTDRPSITFIDMSGQVLDKRGAADAPPVDLKSMPAYVPQAVIAIEDRKFYRHWGFDLFGITRAIITDIKARKVVQGGSTITQQLAKNLFLSSEQTLKRKAQEILLSVWLESRFTKDQIISLYLARVYFGGGAYGLNEAAQRYFNKTPAQLSVAEAAMLAGLLKAPSHYSPLSSTSRAAARATIVLDVMEKEGVISRAQRLGATKTPLKFVSTAYSNNYGYFLDWIEPLVIAQVGEPTEDIIVETTLDAKAQAAATNAINNAINKEGKRLRFSQAAAIAISGDGAVRTLIGGKNYNESEFNRAITAKRQPGSSFKPFVYLTALENGETPYSVYVDQPIKIGNWEPKNYENKYDGPMTMLTAITRSINSIAVQLAQKVGPDKIASVAHRLGINSHIAPELSIALGTQVVSPIELTTAYGAFSNGGAAVTPYGIKRIRTRTGKTIYEYHPPQPRRVIDDVNLRYMNLMLSSVVRSGTGTGANLSNRQVAGKTGTTSDYADAWFVGYVPGYAAAVWIGNDDYKKKMVRVTGGNVPARIWREFMSVATASLPNKSLPMPEGPVPEVDLSIVYDEFGNPINAVAPIEEGEAGTEPVNPPANSATKSPAEAQPAFNEPETRSLDQIIKDTQKKK